MPGRHEHHGVLRQLVGLETVTSLCVCVVCVYVWCVGVWMCGACVHVGCLGVWYMRVHVWCVRMVSVGGEGKGGTNSSESSQPKTGFKCY